MSRFELKGLFVRAVMCACAIMSGCSQDASQVERSIEYQQLPMSELTDLQFDTLVCRLRSHLPDYPKTGMLPMGLTEFEFRVYIQPLTVHCDSVGVLLCYDMRLPCGCGDSSSLFHLKRYIYDPRTQTSTLVIDRIVDANAYVPRRL